MDSIPHPWASDLARDAEIVPFRRPPPSTSTGQLFNRMYPERRSPIPPSKPACSSPLAGPALSASRLLRNAAYSSTPDLPQQDKGSKSYAFGFFQRSVSATGHRPREDDGRRTAPDVAGKRQLLKLRKHRPDRPVSTPPQSNPATPRRTAASPSRPPSSSVLRSTRRHSSAPFQSSSAPALGTQFRVPALAQRAEDTWLTSSPWGDIPRFNRLGLRSPNVVLPLSAKEYHRRRTLSGASLAAPQARRPIPINFDPSHRRSRSFSDVYQVPPPPSLLRQASEPAAHVSSSSHLDRRSEASQESLPSLTRTNSGDSGNMTFPVTLVDCQTRLVTPAVALSEAGNDGLSARLSILSTAPPRPLLPRSQAAQPQSTVLHGEPRPSILSTPPPAPLLTGPHESHQFTCTPSPAGQRRSIPPTDPPTTLLPRLAKPKGPRSLHPLKQPAKPLDLASHDNLEPISQPRLPSAVADLPRSFLPRRFSLARKSKPPTVDYPEISTGSSCEGSYDSSQTACSDDGGTLLAENKGTPTEVGPYGKGRITKRMSLKNLWRSLW